MARTIKSLGIQALDIDGIGDSAVEALRNSFTKKLSTAQLIYILKNPWDFGDGNSPDSTATESRGAELCAENPEITYTDWLKEMIDTIISEIEEYIDIGLVAEPEDFATVKDVLTNPARHHDFSIVAQWLMTTDDLGLTKEDFNNERDSVNESEFGDLAGYAHNIHIEYGSAEENDLEDVATQILLDNDMDITDENLNKSRNAMLSWLDSHGYLEYNEDEDNEDEDNE